MRRFGLVLAVVLSVLMLRASYASEPPTPAPTAVPSGLCATYRWQYGAESAQQAAQLLGTPCHHNWIADSYGVPGHTPTAYSLRPSMLDGYVADASDGEFWLLGSEPNLGVTHIEPSDAAEFVRAWASQTDTSWACCGTMQHWQLPEWLSWMDEYLAAGGPVGDAWHLHIYFVADGREWDATVEQFRQWMLRHDVVRPIIVSETAQTNSHGADALLRHVAQTVCDGDVSAVYWYIGDRDAYDFAPASQLTVDGVITELGEMFVEQQICLADEPTAEDEVEQPVERWRVWLPGVW